MTDFATYADENGTVDFEGKTYALKRQAELTNRVFPGWFGDAAEGEEYTTEYGAPAIDEDGNEYWVTWQFNEVKGEESDDCGSYPWFLGPDDVIPR